MGGTYSAPPPPPEPKPVVNDTAAQDRQDRVDMVERRRRGRGGTIQTSERGLLKQKAAEQPKKQLLGE